MEKYISGLNQEQRNAVLDTEGYVLVFAGAGSGKTRVLTNRIAHLVNDKNVNPANILAITFTNKAADEMKSRLSSMIPGVEKMWVSTIHSMCVRILRNSIGRLEGYNTNFSIYSEIDKNSVLKRIISELKDNEDDKADKYLKKANNYISDAKNKGVGVEDFVYEYTDVDIHTYQSIYSAYEKLLKKSNAMDFDDLLVKTYHLLKSDPEVLDYYSRKFEYIHIDEFQDTNVIQMEIAKLLSSYHKNLFVVGDDDQSIYSWRGAEIKNILDFDKSFQNAKVHKLEQNYRSTKHILGLANTMIAGNTERKPKELWTENPEGEKTEVIEADNDYIEAKETASRIKDLINKGAKAKDFAVLMRINAISRAYEQEFTNRGIPFKVFGGFKFFERAEIKDLIAYMRILINPLDDASILRIINTPRRGIGDKTIDVLKAYSGEFGLNIFDGLVDAERLPLSAGAKSKLIAFRKLITSLMVECAQKPLVEVFLTVIEKTTFLSQFEDKSEESYNKIMNVNEFQHAIEDFSKANPDATLADYLNSITLSSDTDEIEEGNYVSIATIHSVKGLEFPYVFICGLDETIFPVSRAATGAEIEEERRLMYVAITRARKKLFLTRAENRYFRGNKIATECSRFLKVLKPKLGIGDKKFVNFEYSRPKPANPYGSYSFGGYSSSYRGSYDEVADTAPTSTMGYSSGGVKSFSSTSSKPEQKNVVLTGYKSGKKVSHEKFGTGMIIQVKGEGKSMVIDVAFPGLGIKSLAVAYAPIKIID